jgi:hypothetical protein
MTVSNLLEQPCNKADTSLTMPSSLLQVVNSLCQTCWQLGTSSANTTCWRFVGRLYYKMWHFWMCSLLYTCTERCCSEINVQRLAIRHKNPTTCQQHVFATGLSTSYSNVVILWNCYKVVSCHSQLVELQDDNKLLEQLVTSLLSSTTL